MARPCKLPEVAEAILGFVRKGARPEIAARRAGIAPTTLYRWRQRGDSGETEYKAFTDALDQAQATYVDSLRGDIKELGRLDRIVDDSRGDQVKLKANTWLLEREDAEGYGAALRLKIRDDIAKLVLDAASRVLDPESYDRLVAEFVGEGSAAEQEPAGLNGSSGSTH